MKRRAIVPALILAVSALLLVGGCGSNTAADDGAGTSSGDTNTSPAASAPAEQEEAMHESTVKVTGTETAVIETSKGTITLEFYPGDAPNTVASFIELADSGFYNGLKFHRVVPGFVVQGGDPLTRDLSTEQMLAGTGGAGTGGPGWTQKAEFNARKHETGTLAMARARDINSAGSQFYICLAPQPSLDGQYTVFGQVTEGMDVVKSIQVGDIIESITINR